jgi:peptide/nickel transport system substrate-binding protein
MSALRSGKIDILEDLNWEQAASLAKTNPELMQVSRPAFTSNAIGMRVDKAPFNDIRVRKALQMAIDLKTISEAYYGGTGDPTPAGLMSHFYDSWGYSMPYASWTPEVKAEYAYNTAEAKKLLAEAGYPNGFKTVCVASSTSDLDLLQILKSYLLQIHVDMEIQVMEATAWTRFVSDKKHEALYFPSSCAHSDSPPVSINQFLTGFPNNYSGLGDSVYDDLHSKERATFDEDEQKRLTREMDYRVISQHWMVVTPMKVNFCIYQPWLKMYWGQQALRGPEFARFWIDQDLKKSMGK